MELFRRTGFEVIESRINIRVPFFVYGRARTAKKLGVLRNLENAMNKVCPGAFGGRDFIFVIQKVIDSI
jgi:hypothetical protein